MKMNRPEMEVVRFEVADVIATSGGVGPIIYYYEYTIFPGRPELGIPDTEDLYDINNNVQGDLSSFKSQITNPENGATYSFDGTNWARVG